MEANTAKFCKLKACTSLFAIKNWVLCLIGLSVGTGSTLINSFPSKDKLLIYDRLVTGGAMVRILSHVQHDYFSS